MTERPEIEIEAHTATTATIKIGSASIIVGSEDMIICAGGMRVTVRP